MRKFSKSVDGKKRCTIPVKLRLREGELMDAEMLYQNHIKALSHPVSLSFEQFLGVLLLEKINNDVAALDE